MASADPFDKLRAGFLPDLSERITPLAAMLSQTQHRMIKQISPDKSMNYHSTTASFTVSTEPRALLSCANLPADSAFYDVSVPFGKLRAGSGSLLCYRLPSHKASRLSQYREKQIHQKRIQFRQRWSHKRRAIKNFKLFTNILKQIFKIILR